VGVPLAILLNNMRKRCDIEEEKEKYNEEKKNIP
jgi:hypothetical protein